MKVIGVIPARLESTRLSRKVLRPIAGKPLIQHVYENVCEAESLDEVVIACDSEEIRAACEAFRANVCLTSKEHQSGTERIYEVSEKIKGDIYVNVQGDEPLMPGRNIDLLIKNFKDRQEFLVGTLAIKKTEKQDYINPNVVKTLFDKEGRALYFSRSAIPHYRDESLELEYWKHLGIYAYRSEFMRGFMQLESSDLEIKEKLEQLRFLDNGIAIQVIETAEDSIGVDTEEDLKLVESLLG